MARAAGDEELGKIARQQHEVFRRVRDGSMSVKQVLRVHKQLSGTLLVRFDASVSWDDAVRRCNFDTVYVPNKHRWYHPIEHIDVAKALPPLDFTGICDAEVILRKLKEDTERAKVYSCLNKGERLVHPLLLLALAAQYPYEQLDSSISTRWGLSWQLALREDGHWMQVVNDSEHGVVGPEYRVAIVSQAA
ncbi:MAG: hypothetical protein PHU42_00545 [Patescibacteria group bacterium]|nr:hypothetical protein [Patescibacteria group bacterium]